MKLFCFDLTKGSNKYIAAKYCKTAFICYFFFYIYFIYSIFIMFIELNIYVNSDSICFPFVHYVQRFLKEKLRREKKTPKKPKKKTKKKDTDRRTGWLIYLSFLVFSSVHLGVSKT